jgi:hypothetical protein
VALLAGPGIADDDLDVYERAQALRTRRGLDADPSTLRIKANAAIERRDYPRAQRIGEALLQRGDERGDSVLITEGHYLMGVTSFWLGDLHLSRRHLDDALCAHRIRNTPVHLSRFGQDPRAVCLVRLALTSFHLGDEAAAAQGCAAALEASAELSHDYTDFYVRTFAAWYLTEAGRADEAGKLVGQIPSTTPNRVAVIARTQFTGWALTQQGDPLSGVRHLRCAWQWAHDSLFEPYVLILLARSQLAAGDPCGALNAAVAARGIAARQMPVHLPETHRLTGELVMATGGDPQEGLASLANAAQIATRHGAVVDELRARTSLLRAARAHEPASVPAHERALEALCDRLPTTSLLGELAAARREVATVGSTRLRARG